MGIETEYLHRCTTPSDINEHLPAIRKYATKCKHITEFGVRSGNSTIALACGRPEYMVSYDINLMPPDLMDTIRAEIPFIFHQRDVLTVDIEPTDLLFIDTLHTYHQLCRELILHAWAVHRYIILHDTVTFGTTGEDGRIPGLRAAIYDGLGERKWRAIRDDQNNNGLMVMERIS
jgi:hypothetical protein